jgi:hypothetical protein
MLTSRIFSPASPTSKSGRIGTRDSVDERSALRISKHVFTARPLLHQSNATGSSSEQ